MIRNTYKSISLTLIFIFILSSLIVTIQINQSTYSSPKDSNNKISLVSSQTVRNNFNNALNKNLEINNILDRNQQFYFTKNIGQLGKSSIAYYFTTNGYQVNFLPSEIQFVQRSSINGKMLNYEISFSNSNLVKPVGAQNINQLNNYFIGKNNFTNVPLFKELTYYNIYNGIDLKYYFNEQGLKYDFIVHPGANPNQIMIKSSSDTVIQAMGSTLSINSKLNSLNLLVDKNLFVYQKINSQVNPIEASYQPSMNPSNGITYKITYYNSNYDLIIDPVLIVNTSTYLGGTGNEQGNDIVLDAQNNIYITGTTDSINFLVKDAINTTYSNNTDIFILKINSTGTGIIWSTYFGGNGVDNAVRIALDKNSNVIIAGTSSSTDLPLTINSQNAHLNGSSDGLLVVLSNDGQTLRLCSLIGGDQDESINGLFVPTGTNDYYLTGSTTSSNFITTNNAINKTYYNNTDAFLVKTSITGSISYSSFIGGNNYDEGIDVALDSQNNIYILGSTSSKLEGIATHGLIDTFVMKLSSTGSLINTTIIGGSLGDYASSMTINNNQIYITGTTYSSNFPTTSNAYERILNKTVSSAKAFIIKMETSFIIDYSTFFGATGTTKSNKILVNSNGEAYIFGWTTSNSIPLKYEYRKGILGGQDGLIAAFTADGTNITYSSIFGGSQLDQITSGVFGSQNLIYFTGITNSLNYPVNNAINSSNAYIGTNDMFLTIISPDYISPTLELKPNFSYTYQTTGNYLSFNASDNDPEAFYKIYKDNIQVATNLLSSNQVNYSVDGLSIGTYNYTVLVQDRTGNKIAGTTIIKVVSSNTGPFNVDFNNGMFSNVINIGLIAAGFIVVAGILGYVIVNKRKKRSDLTLQNVSQDANIETIKSPDTTNELSGTEQNTVENMLSEENYADNTTLKPENNENTSIEPENKGKTINQDFPKETDN